MKHAGGRRGDAGHRHPSTYPYLSVLPHSTAAVLGQVIVVEEAAGGQLAPSDQTAAPCSMF